MVTKSLVRSLLLTPFFLALALPKSLGCYFPNGEPSPTEPCLDGSSRPAGLCCNIGDLCLNNSLCARGLSINQPVFYRGSCTDSTWSSPSCPRYCVGDQDRGRMPDVLLCSNDGEHTDWTCAGNAPPTDDACSRSDAHFTLSGNMTSYGKANAKDSPPERPGDTDTPGSTSSLGRPTRETAAIDQAASSARESATPTGHDQAPSSPATSSASNTPEDGNKVKSSLAIGLGIGVNICVLIAVAILGILYWRKRKRKSYQRASTPSQLAAMYGIRLSDIPGADRYRRGRTELN